MTNVNVISTIDLWLPHNDNRLTIYDKVFRAGFERKGQRVNEAITTSYDSYRIVKNCYCTLSCPSFGIPTRQTAIVFYRNGQPTRLLIDNVTGDEIEKCINHALVQRIGSLQYNSSLTTIFDRKKITFTTTDIAESSVLLPAQQVAEEEPHLESHLLSCNRWDLLLQFIDNNKNNAKPYTSYTLDLDFQLSCRLEVDHLLFHIEHRGAFISPDKQQYIMFQRNSSIMP